MNINKLHNPLNNNKGITIVLVAILLFVLVGFVGLALDISYMYVVKGQLQNAADAGALAGAAKLNEAYGSAPCDPSLYLSSVKTEAKRISEQNNAAGTSLSGAVELTAGVNELTDDNDITIGFWDSATATYTPTMTNPNAVQVRVRRTTQSPLGQVRLFISRVLGWETMGTAAEAVADSEPASLAPIVVNEYWLDKEVMNRKDPSDPIWKNNPQVPYAKEVHAYPNSFVRDTSIGPIYGTEKAFGKIFAILGSQANSNVPASEVGGDQAINGFVNLNFRSSSYDAVEGTWYQLGFGAKAVEDCYPSVNVFDGPLAKITQGDVRSTSDLAMQYLVNGYDYVPPTAVKEKYTDKYYLTEYTKPNTSDKPYATVAHMETSGKVSLNQEVDGKSFQDVYPPGEQIVAMVYDGTFNTDHDPKMPNAVTVVGYVLLQIDGYSSKEPSQMTEADKKTIKTGFWGNNGNTAYAHAVAPMIEGGRPFSELYPEINGLRWRGGKVRLVMNRGIF
ncbi:MAG: hypothetical protein HYS23_15885 [Geobacter sp.]|nr:hypothetical protein [Geobacter sp.]